MKLDKFYCSCELFERPLITDALCGQSLLLSVLAVPFNGYEKIEWNLKMYDNDMKIKEALENLERGQMTKNLKVWNKFLKI